MPSGEIRRDVLRVRSSTLISGSLVYLTTCIVAPVHASPGVASHAGHDSQKASASVIALTRWCSVMDSRYTARSMGLACCDTSNTVHSCPRCAWVPTHDSGVRAWVPTHDSGVRACPHAWIA